MIIDFHAHLYGGEPDNLPRLLSSMDRLGIERTCLSAFGPHFNWGPGNAEVAAAVKAHPDRLSGFIFIRPGRDKPDLIRAARDQGFQGVKVTCPTVPYDDRSYYDLWAAAAEAKLPVLFHTGIVTLPAARPDEDISSVRMRPILLEPISRAFPELKIVCAHLGIHWNADAAELLRMRPNIYADLSGEPGGWRERVLPHRLREYLWWPGAFGKLLFGSDVTPEKIERNLQQDREALEMLGVPIPEREKYFRGNAAELLGYG